MASSVTHLKSSTVSKNALLHPTAESSNIFHGMDQFVIMALNEPDDLAKPTQIVSKLDTREAKDIPNNKAVVALVARELLVTVTALDPDVGNVALEVTLKGASAEVLLRRNGQKKNYSS